MKRCGKREYMNNLSSLTIMDGKPAFSKKPHVNLPNMGNREVFMSHVNSVLDSHQFTNNGCWLKNFRRS